MTLTSRSKKQALYTLFPGNYWVYRNLCLQIPDNGVSVTPIPYSILRELLPVIVARIQSIVEVNPDWTRFRGITEDKLDLVESISVTASVNPTTWWCTSCGKVYNGLLSRVGIRQGKCPSCAQRALVQLNSVFMCPQCHTVEPVEPVICNQCGDSRSVILRGFGGRRREYHWACTKHPSYEVYLQKRCRTDGNRMVLKSTGGRLFDIARLTNVSAAQLHDRTVNERGDINFIPSHATVIDALVGKRPVADFNAFYTGHEDSPIQPFINTSTGNFICFIHRLETDAITIKCKNHANNDNLILHSLKHALINAAPAVTGLTQDEFGADIDLDAGELIFYDNVLGGTGGCHLLSDRRLDRWLQVARELAECHQGQCQEACRACLFLPTRICRQGNHDLNRYKVLDLIPES